MNANSSDASTRARIWRDPVGRLPTPCSRRGRAQKPRPVAHDCFPLSPGLFSTENRPSEGIFWVGTARLSLFVSTQRRLPCRVPFFSRHESHRGAMLIRVSLSGAPPSHASSSKPLTLRLRNEVASMTHALNALKCALGSDESLCLVTSLRCVKNSLLRSLVLSAARSCTGS